MSNSYITDTLFRDAVEAIDTGNIIALQQLLGVNADLVTKRLDTPNEDGYFKNPYLLWFVADNPIRHEKLSPNIVEVTKTIIKALQKSNDNNYQFIIDYTLGLVSTGRIPKECGVQIPLMEVLINNGAKVKGGVLGSIGHHNFEVAKFLLDKGADYNLATAVGLDKLDDVKRFSKTATSSELYVSLVVAFFFGKVAIISLLIETGVNVNGSGSKEDFGGFHAHASALHQAVYSGSLEAVKLLVEAGANLNATDKAFSGAPLGWAMYMQTEENDETAKKKYKEIENYLSAK
ncbi:MAG: ankyrin repeat domain-containing protein [Leadbetterella sp.]|nr:ankyrin repeat domain-containing protein [Leadbetterella sp.]